MNKNVTLATCRTSVEEMLRARNNHRVTASEADFIAGAGTVMDHVFGDGEHTTIPPGWIIAGMVGRPILEDCPPPETEDRKLLEWIAGACRAHHRQRGPSHTSDDPCAWPYSYTAEDLYGEISLALERAGFEVEDEDE